MLNYKTDNSYELRKELARLGYPCLSFSTKGKYIRLGSCKWANSQESFIENYSCASDDFSDVPDMNFEYVDRSTFLCKILGQQDRR